MSQKWLYNMQELLKGSPRGIEMKTMKEQSYHERERPKSQHVKWHVIIKKRHELTNNKVEQNISELRKELVVEMKGFNQASS